MCINPQIHPNGLKTPCRKCWQCKQNRINDWVGRCIAERETCVKCVTVTLTYGGGDTPESRFLRKSDITAFVKELRNDGHKIRYFATGEYGSRKGRAHWHVVLFWWSEMPELEFEENIHVPWWPHGHTYWKEGHIEALRYVMKYINKADNDDMAMKTMAMSRKPMLGSYYFRDLALRYIKQGLVPHRPFYKFRDVLDKRGKPLEFYMPPLVALNFVREYITQWMAINPGKHWPTSELVDKYHDLMVGYEAPLALEKRKVREAPWMEPPGGARELFDDKLNCYYAVVGGERLYWSFDENGRRSWERKIVTETEAERRAAAFDARRMSAMSSGR